jgi:hypothetical protein
MRKIVLTGPAVDKNGNYRDAGSELVVGGEDNETADLTTATADALIEGGRAMTLTEAREVDAASAELVQLDHDGDGTPGGSLPGEQSTAAVGAARKRTRR